MASRPIAEDEIKSDRQFMSGIIARQIFDGNLDFTALDRVIPDLKHAHEGIPPERLYHYSSFTGTNGIVHAQHIWCSSVFHMNDPAEYSHAFQLFKECVLKIQKRYNHPGFRSLTQLAINQITKQYINSMFLPFITCFTDKRDFPSQWEWYAEHGNGASMEFSGIYLKALSFYLNDRPDHQPEVNPEYFFSHFIKVIYDEAIKRDIVRTSCINFAEFVIANNIT